MIDIKIIRETPDVLRQALKNRNAKFDIEPILEVDAARRKLVYEAEQLKAELNRESQEIAQLKKAKQDATAQIAAMKEVSDKIKALDEQRKELDQQLENMLLVIPNIPDERAPVGKDETEGVEVRRWGTPPTFDFEPKDHVELGQNLGLLDFDRASRISGARFILFRGAGSLLERALINFMLDTHTREHGYTEFLPPFLVNSDTMRASGQLPKFSEEAFCIKDRDLWLIPTAEVPLTSIHRDEIIDADQLPLKYCAYTPCFRSEAGSYGKDTRGILRQHQFDKVELYKFTTPEQSWDELEMLTNNAEAILEKLGLPYRVMALCTGDMGFSSAKTYDLEVWLPGQNTYREISSCSNCTDFQARRANIRFKRDKKPEFVHTLNGSGLAVGRTLIAILENYQQADGTIVVPPVLRGYMNGLEVIKSW